MSRLEIIHLRLAGGRPGGLVDQIRASIAGDDCPTEVAVFHHARVSTDLAIHLRSGGSGDGVSDLGIRLAAALREYGMVEHTVWVEEK